MEAELLRLRRAEMLSICSGLLNIGDVTHLNSLAVYQLMTIDSYLAIYQFCVECIYLFANSCTGNCAWKAIKAIVLSAYCRNAKIQFVLQITNNSGSSRHPQFSQDDQSWNQCNKSATTPLLLWSQYSWYSQNSTNPNPTPTSSEPYNV